MAKSKESKIASDNPGPVGESVSVIESGLDKKTVEAMYKKLKNEGKCCEGGSEGWMG